MPVLRPVLAPIYKGVKRRAINRHHAKFRAFLFDIGKDFIETGRVKFCAGMIALLFPIGEYLICKLVLFGVLRFVGLLFF